MSVYQEEYDVTGDRRHDKADRIRHSSEFVYDKIRNVCDPKQRISCYLDFDKFYKCFKRAAFFLFCHV